MIGRHRAIPRSQRSAAQVGKLLGMQLNRQAKAAGGLKYAFDLCRRKGDAFAEPVHRIDQPFGMGRVQRGNANLIDIGVGTTHILHGDSMRRQKACPHQNWPQPANTPRRTQHPQFGVLLQPIT